MMALKEDEARELLDKLYDKMDRDDGLNAEDQAMFEVLAWLLENATKPKID